MLTYVKGIVLNGETVARRTLGWHHCSRSMTQEVLHLPDYTLTSDP